MADRWVCLDVGETLIDETRVWSLWAEVLGMSRLTLMAGLGAAIERANIDQNVFHIVRRPDWRDHLPRLLDVYGPFRDDDLYPDARRCLTSLKDQGYRIAIAANQPARRTAELRELGIAADMMAMSDELQLWKPDPAFFERCLELMGGPDPADVAYVGDRVDNDVRPSSEIGMRAVWVRRGPWGMIGRDEPRRAALVVASLDEVAAKIGECWSQEAIAGGATPAHG